MFEIEVEVLCKVLLFYGIDEIKLWLLVFISDWMEFFVGECLCF